MLDLLSPYMRIRSRLVRLISWMGSLGLLLCVWMFRLGRYIFGFDRLKCWLVLRWSETWSVGSLGLNFLLECSVRWDGI